MTFGPRWRFHEQHSGRTESRAPRPRFCGQWIPRRGLNHGPTHEDLYHPSRGRGRQTGRPSKDAGPNNQRLYVNGARVAQIRDTQPLDLTSTALGIGRHVSGIADPFNGHMDEFRIAHVQHSDGWIETTWNNMSGID
jgi:hypothetical protein